MFKFIQQWQERRAIKEAVKQSIRRARIRGWLKHIDERREAGETLSLIVWDLLYEVRYESRNDLKRQCQILKDFDEMVTALRKEQRDEE